MERELGYQNRIVGHGTKPASQFQAHPNNWRKHPKNQRSAVKGSLESLGWVAEVIENKTTGRLIDGHERVWNALQNGDADVPYIQVELTEAEEAQALLSLDAIAALAETDREQVDALLKQVETDNADVMQFLTDFARDNKLDWNQPEQGDAEPQIDRAAELLEKWKVETGDLWQIGDHRLLCGDSTKREDVERVMGGEKAILMVTDPPYGVEYSPEWRDEVDKKGLLGNLPAKALGKVENDTQDDWTETYKLFNGDICYVWHADQHAKQVQISLESCGFILISQIIWRKPQGIFSRGDYHWQHEPCLYMVRKNKNHNWQGSRTETTIWDIAGMSPFGKSTNEQNKTTGHGTQKPIDCMSKPIENNTMIGDLVYEPFAGSGTTMVACQNLNRKCRAVEISEKYCAVILQRMFDAFPGIEIHRR